MKVQHYTLAKTNKVTFGGEMGWNEKDGGCGYKKNMKRLFAILASYNTCWEFHNHAKAGQEGQKWKNKKRLEREDIWQLCSLKSTKNKFNTTECKLVDKAIKGECEDCFPLNNKLIEGIKFFIHQFFLVLKCKTLFEKHKDKTKAKISQYHLFSTFAQSLCS